MKYLNILSVYWLWLCHLLVLIPTTASLDRTYFHERGCDTRKRAQSFDADFIIGGIFPTHRKKKDGDKVKFKPYYVGVNWVSSMLYAIDQINNNTKLLPGLKLGYDIRDSCNEVEIAAKHSLDFMLDVNYYRPKLSVNDSVEELCIDRKNSNSKLVGVIGGSASPVSSLMSTILSTDYIPQISYASTSASLTQKSSSRSFLRTVPSDKHQARALVDLIKYYGWNYVSAFAIDDEYGRLGLDELLKVTKEKDICLATAHTFDPKLKKDDLEDIMLHLEQFRDKSHIVILWSTYPEAEQIMTEAYARNITNITWIGTEVWSEDLDKLPFKIAQNAIMLELDQPSLPYYLKYMTTSLATNWKNPWFRSVFPSYFCLKEEIKRKKQGCFIQMLPIFATAIIGKTRRKYPQVIAAVYSLAFGLHKYLNCTETNCTITKGGIDYKKLYETIRVCDFKVPNTTDYHVSFDKKTRETKQKEYKYLLRFNGTSFTFGSWLSAGNLTIDDSKINWGRQGKPEGRCSSNCQPGSFRLNGSIPCCWTCPKCQGNTVTAGLNDYRCKRCQKDYEVANDNRTQCIRLREIRITIENYIGLMLLASSIVGVLITSFIIAVFLRYWNTPVVKSSSREISVIQLVSLMLLFCLPVMYFFKLTPLLCVFRTLAFGFLLTTVVSIILVKTYRLLRVFGGRFTKVSRFLRNKYQILFIYSLVLFELVAILLWNYIFTPEILRDVHMSERIFYITCDKHQTIIFWIVLLYIFILTLFSGYVAFRARKLPENYNEAQFISLSMFTACVVWLAYVPLFFSLASNENNVAFLVQNFVCTICITVILYFYKVKIILFHPHINSPEHARQAHNEHFINSFHEDVAKRQMSEKENEPFRARLNSLPVAVHKASVFDDDTDGKGQTSDERTKLVETNLKARRSSFSSMSTFESMKKYKSYDTFVFDPSIDDYRKRQMKKSQSTPFLGDETPPLTKSIPKSATTNRPFSHIGHFGQSIGRVISSVSMNKLLSVGQEKNESRGLLCSDTEDAMVNTML